MTAQERFWSKVDITDSCWVWTGPATADGYPLFWDGEATRKAIRFLLGQTEVGHHRHHLCGNTLCVRPDHLRVVTAAEHVQVHAVERKTCPRGHRYSHQDERQRHCQTCRREATRRWRLRQKERV